MFENIDEITIQNANRVIHDLYDKISDPVATSVVSKEEIVYRDFSNTFIFEDFFNDYLLEHDTDPESQFFQSLLEDITDLILVNEGKISIQELYEFATEKKVLSRQNIPSKSHHLISKKQVLDIKVPDNLFVSYDGKQYFGFSEVDDSKTNNINEIAKRVAHETKKEQMRLKLNASLISKNLRTQYNEHMFQQKTEDESEDTLWKKLIKKKKRK